MNTIAKQIFRAVHEGKWLYVEYCNKKSNQISRFWIGIKNIIENRTTKLCTLECSGLHLHNYTLADNMQLSVDRILSASTKSLHSKRIICTCIPRSIFRRQKTYHSRFFASAMWKK